MADDSGPFSVEMQAPENGIAGFFSARRRISNSHKPLTVILTGVT
jgi:hypothetical protein